MKILVACEYSGVVRDAFIRRGFNAISCDLLPTESEGPHIQGDVAPLLKQKWDIVIAHPPCQYLCLSGVRWLYEEPGRWEKMKRAADFFNLCLQAGDRVAVENPTMHRHACIRKPDFSIQPWQFGHGETKRTCFWTRGLPALIPTDIVQGREARIHKLAPSADRSKIRSRTYSGVAEAIAEQWSKPNCSLFD